MTIPSFLISFLLLLTTGISAMASDNISQSDERMLLIHALPARSGNQAEQAAISSVFEGIVEKLSEKGYRVVDKATAEKCSREIAVTHDINPQLNKAAAYGLKFLAEYTLFYRTAIITKENEGGNGALIRVNAKIVDNSSAQILTSKSSEASSAGMTVEDAIDKAGRASGKKLASQLTDALSRSRQQPGHTGQIYSIIIENTFPDLSVGDLLPALERSSSVTGAREVESGGGKTTFEIRYKGRRDQLDRELTNTAGTIGIRLFKIRSEGNRSTWKTIK